MEREGSRRRANAREEREGGKRRYSFCLRCFVFVLLCVRNIRLLAEHLWLAAATPFCSDAWGLSGKRGSHLCERRWKQTSNDHSLPVPSPFGCRSADCAERRECGVREGGEEGGCRLGPSAFHLR